MVLMGVFDHATASAAAHADGAFRIGIDEDLVLGVAADGFAQLVVGADPSLWPSRPRL